jgi:negative regulator of sigma E activity
MKQQAQLTESELELLSRSLDEDLSEFDLKRLSKQVLSKADAEETWARYHAISAVMQKQFPANISKDFSANVIAAIEYEEMQQESTTIADDTGVNKSKVGTLRSYMKQFAGLAVAASVAAVSVVIYQQQFQHGVDNNPAIIVSDKQEIREIQPSTASNVTILPVEFSPIQVPVERQIIGLGDIEKNFSDIPEKDITDLEEVIGLQDSKE